MIPDPQTVAGQSGGKRNMRVRNRTKKSKIAAVLASYPVIHKEWTVHIFASK
jgi:hypothetical protein